MLVFPPHESHDDRGFLLPAADPHAIVCVAALLSGVVFQEAQKAAAGWGNQANSVPCSPDAIFFIWGAT